MADAVAARPGRWHEDISAFADDNGLKKVLVLSSGSFVPSFRSNRIIMSRVLFLPFY